MGLRLLGRQLGLLGRSRGFRLLWLASLGSSLGTWIAFVALTVHVYDATGSATWVSALLVAEFAPTVVVGLLLGPLVDRLSRRRIAIASDVVRAGAFVALVFVESPAAVVALAGVAGTAGAFFRPALYAALPNLVDDEDLPSANSLFHAVESLATAAGPIIGGAIVAVDEDWAYGLNAASFVVSALLIAKIPAGALQEGAAKTRGHLRDIGDALALTLRSRPLLVVLVAWSVICVSSAVLNVSEVFLAKDVFGAGDVGFGLVVGAAGLGIGLGSLAGGVLVERFGVLRIYVGGMVALGAATLAAAVAPALWVALPFILVLGVGNGAALVANALLVQHGAPDAFRGRVFTFLMGVTALLTVGGMAVAGPLTNAAGARWAWGASAALSLLAAAIAVTLGRGVRLPAGAAAAAPAPVMEPVARETEATV